MKTNKVLLTILIFCLSAQLKAGFDPELYRMIVYRDSLENALKYDKGMLEFPRQNATLYVPSGFKALNRETSVSILPTVWKTNVPDGLAFTMYPSNGGPFDSRNERYTICEWGTGHVFDGNFTSGDSTLSLPQDDDTLWNAWKIAPTYDPNRHILWYVRSFNTKSDSFERFEITFYFLGKSTVIRCQSFNMMYDYNMVIANIPNMLEAVSFKSGQGYEDYTENEGDKTIEIADLLGIKSKNNSEELNTNHSGLAVLTGLFIISLVILILILRKRKSK